MKNCIVCGVGSHRLDWAKATGPVACDSHGAVEVKTASSSEKDRIAKLEKDRADEVEKRKKAEQVKNLAKPVAVGNQGTLNQMVSSSPAQPRTKPEEKV